MTEPLLIPARELINVVALAQALIFATVLLIPRFRRSRANWFLVGALFILAMVKADQLYQALDGFRLWPSMGYVLAPIQWLLTPCLYFFVLARVNPDFDLRKQQLVHVLPALFALAYFSQYYLLDATAKVDLLESGWQGSNANRLLIPLVSDGIQLLYLGLAIREIKRFGIGLRDWFSRVEGRDIRWMRHLLTLWAAAVLAHAVFTLSRGLFGVFEVSRWVLDGMNLVHLAFINALMILGVIDHLVQQNEPIGDIGKSHYRGSRQTATERQHLYENLSKTIEADELYRQPDLTLGDLAQAVSASPRETSEAINSIGRSNFYDFVNSYRVRYAAKQLIDQPRTQVIQIAFDAGFNNKSTFNQAFKQHLGQTPSQYRESLAE